jgi:hypothetical protein
VKARSPYDPLPGLVRVGLRVATPSPRLLGVMPETRYAKTVDDVHIAYKVIGDGPSDLVIAGWAMNVDALWGWERHADALRRLASFSRVLAFDRRGTGASDHIADRSRQQSLEARNDDIRAVMDAGGVRASRTRRHRGRVRAHGDVRGHLPRANLGADRLGASARSLWASDYLWGISATAWDEEARDVERRWGTIELAREWSTAYVFPDLESDEERIERFALWMRSTGGRATLSRCTRWTETRTSVTSCRSSVCLP